MSEGQKKTGAVRVVEGDSLDVLRRMPAESVDAIITDPPYGIGGHFTGRAKDNVQEWDVFPDQDRFLEFIGDYLDEFRRVLKPKGSLFIFAAPRNASGVEMETAKRFRVLNQIVWRKPFHGGGLQRKESLRRFWDGSERIIFAEHGSADREHRNAVQNAIHAERAEAFREIREYLRDAWAGAGLKNKDANTATGSQMGGHYFNASQWAFPTRDKYERLRAYALEKTGALVLDRGWDDLKARYDEIAQGGGAPGTASLPELRRPFRVSANVPWDDVWTFPIVRPSAPDAPDRRHACEKPLPLLEHIITAATKPGDLILDAFAGSGSLGEAAALNGRRALLIEKDPYWVRRMRSRLADHLDDSEDAVLSVAEQDRRTS